MHRNSFLIVILWAILVLGINISPSKAQTTSGYDIVAAVNDFRVLNGLERLEADLILMSVAQAHSNYQASIKTVTHTGADGSNATDRAYAAGFGGGAAIYTSENVAGGINLTIQEAIYEFWQDAFHLNTLLNPSAVFIGAGVANAGDYVYYTVVVGYTNGGQAPGDNTNLSGLNPATGQIGTPDDAMLLSTPREDGATIHITASGQTLISIATAYKVPLNDLLQLNGLTMDSIIYPGDEIIIYPGYTPTATHSPTATQPSATPTGTTTRSTPTPRGTFTPNPTISPTPTLTPTPLASGREQLILGVVMMALVVFLAVVISGFLAANRMKTENGQEPNEEPSTFFSKLKNLSGLFKKIGKR